MKEKFTNGMLILNCVFIGLWIKAIRRLLLQSLLMINFLLLGNGFWLTVRSASGVVNVYSTTDVLKSSNPAPLKSIMNLTTSVSVLKFNHDSQILA